MSKRPTVLESTAQENGGSQLIPFKITDRIVYIINDDSTNDIIVNLDATVDQGGAFTVKAGEIVNDLIGVSCDYIALQSVGGPVAYRIVGI